MLLLSHAQQEKYLRSLAEMENVRERAKHQVEDAKHYGIQKFAKDMLEIADVLEVIFHSHARAQEQTNLIWGKMVENASGQLAIIIF